MKDNVKLSDFEFYVGYGNYAVSYTSPITGKVWICITDDKVLIDETKNAEKIIKTNLIKLKRLCKKGCV